MISVSSPAFSVIEFGEALDLIGNNFQAWEVVAEGRHYLPDIERQFLDLTPSYDLEFSAHAPMSDINIGSLNPRMREASVKELIDGLEACNRLGVDVYTLHPGFLTPLGFVDEDGVLGAVRSSLRRIDAVAQDTGVRVALENMPRSPIAMGETAQELLSMLDGTDLGICFDTGHAHTTGQIDAFLELSDRFLNVHVHDNRGERDEHLPIGEGTIDFPSLLGRLRGYQGRLVIESRSLNDALVSKDRLTKLLL